MEEKPGTMSEQIAVGTIHGVYVLEAQGREWKIVGQGLLGKRINCLAPTSGRLWAGIANNGLASSQDLRDWHPAVNSLSGISVSSITTHPEQASVLLCGASPVALHLSFDHGQNFQELPSLRQHPGSSHWSHPAPPYRSRLQRLYLHPRDANVLVAGICTGGVYLSGDVGQSWHERIQGVGRQIHDLALHAETPSRLYAATPIGFYLSDDMGEHWQERNHGLAYLHTGALAVHPENPDILFLTAHRNAQGGGAVYRSSNGGQRWEVCEGIPFKPSDRYDAMIISGNSLVVGNQSGEVYLSRDLGSTWGKIRSALPSVTCLSWINI